MKRCSRLVVSSLLAAIQRDAFDVFPNPDQRIAEIRLDPLLAEHQRRQRAAGVMGANRADDGVNQRDPDQ